MKKEGEERLKTLIASKLQPIYDVPISMSNIDVHADWFTFTI